MLLALAFGVLIDADHYLDYVHETGGFRVRFREAVSLPYSGMPERVFLLAHAFEYLPLVYFAWQATKGRTWALAATSAMTSHLLGDHAVNHLKPLGYFITYR